MKKTYKFRYLIKGGNPSDIKITAKASRYIHVWMVIQPSPNIKMRQFFGTMQEKDLFFFQISLPGGESMIKAHQLSTHHKHYFQTDLFNI